jgi:hypothetical protein
MKSEHMSDWFRVTLGQLWSFKLEDAHNRLHSRSDHHWPLKDGSHDRAIQDMKDFFDWRKSDYPLKKFQHIEGKNWSHRVIFSYWTHHQPRDISEEGSHNEDEATILSKTVGQLGSNGGVQSVRGTCNHVNSVKHRADICRLSWVACWFPSFTDVRGKWTGCDFLDLDDGVGLSPSLDTRGGLL